MTLEDVKNGFLENEFNKCSSFYIAPLNDYVSPRLNYQNGEFYFVTGGGTIFNESQLEGHEFRLH